MPGNPGENIQVLTGKVPSEASFSRVRFQNLTLGAMVKYDLGKSGYAPRTLCDLTNQQVPLGEGPVLPKGTVK